MHTKEELIVEFQSFLLSEPSNGYKVNGCSKAYDSYDIEKMSDFANNFDETNELTVVYLAMIVQWQIDHTSCPMVDVLVDSKTIAKYRKCVALAGSEEVQSIRGKIIKKVAEAVNATSKQKWIGTTEAIGKVVDDAIAALFDEFRHLRLEIYQKSGQPVGTLTTTSLSVQSSNSLAECLLRLEKSPDGIYVCFISNPGTLDGWFGFFVKSNGNLFSYNERINEAYIGQHGNMRNGRYAEGKAYGLFPYELVKFSEETDYKGYSKEISIGDELKLVSGNNYSVLIRMLLAMGVIAQKHNGRTLEGEEVIVNSLLPNNLAQLTCEESKTTALVEWRGSPLVELTASKAVPDFEEDKVLKGVYDKDFNDMDGASFCGVNKDMVDAYGEGFSIDRSKVLSSDSSRRLIGDGTSEQEFIGSHERLRLQAYYEVRKQLANHIGKKMEDDYKAFGGADGLWDWFAARLKERMPKVLECCLKAYDALDEESKSGIVKIGKGWKQTNSPSETFSCCESPIVVRASRKVIYNKHRMSESKDGHYICPITGAQASVWFSFEFNNYLQVEDFLGIPLPKFCTGWHSNGLYNGNSILRVCDPVGNLEGPLKDDHFFFDFMIALSKRAIQKARKELVSKESKDNGK